MSDEMDLPPSLTQRSIDAVVQPSLYQDVRALRINPDAGVVRAISDSLEPRMKLSKVSVCAEKSGDKNDRRAIAARHAPSVIHGRSMQQQDVGGEQRLLP